jgi:DNA-binding MarR family transcriptional regulator
MHTSRAANVVGAFVLALRDTFDREQDPATPAAALIHLSHCREPTIESLRKVLGLSHSATVRVADRLESSGLAVRDKTAANRRITLLRLTASGEELAKAALDKRMAALVGLLDAALTPDEQEQLTVVADKVLRAATANRDDLYRICRLCDFDACPSCPVAEAVSA